VNGYLQALERSPALLERMKQAAETDLNLRGEAALARALLTEVLGKLAQIHQRNGKLDAETLVVAQNMVREVSGVIERASNIEAKKIDQGIDAAKLVLLMSNLRNDLQRSLERAGFNNALPYIDAAFERAKWTGDLSEEVVNSALAAPASYDVKFRVIERDGPNGKPKESADLISKPEEALRAPTQVAIEKIKEEIAELEGKNGNGHAKTFGVFDDEDEDEDDD
jgi:hypothetical protein